jgi:hypothetical protein
MQLLDFETFASRANEAFALEVGEASVDLTLVQVSKLTPHPYPGMRRAPFRLLFKCPKLTILPQKIYSFRNATMGQLSIFIMPIGRDKDGILYEAIFN